MLFKCIKGMFQLQENYRDAFDLEMFVSKYIEECFDRYPYLVGDISSGILRLKGFENNPKSDSYIGNVRGYLETSCSFGCPYYIIKRVKSDAEYENLENAEKNKKPIEEKPLITPIIKESFDKESLILKSTPKVKARIHIDSTKINKIPQGILPKDLEEIIKQDAKESSNPKKEESTQHVETASYVSASPDFDPSKIKKNRNDMRQNNNRNNNNNNSNNNNKHKKNNKNKSSNSNKV
mgnify:CR=1 FL=1